MAKEKSKILRATIFTVGHSTRTIQDFIDLLQAYGIKELVDIRTIPKSFHNPQFNKEELRASLKKAHIRYSHNEKLGGLRHVKKDSINLGWRNLSFRGFADYMATTDFEEGLDTLMAIAKARPTAIMCAEAVPWRCHRSMVGDALIKSKWIVRDIMSRTSAPKRKLTPFLKMKRGKITYPGPVISK